MGAARVTRKRRPVFGIRTPINRTAYWILACIGLMAPFALWISLQSSGLVDPLFLPSPLKVIEQFFRWYTEGDLLGDMWISIWRVTAAFALSAILALPLGLWIGTFRLIEALTEPLIDFIRYMPATAFIPLIMLWVGIGEGAKIAVIFIGTFFQMVLMIAEDVRRVPMSQIEATQTMGATRFELLSLIILPAAKPAILDTLRITLGWAWTYLVVAELVASSSGLGFNILKAQRYLQTDKIFVGIILIGLIGMFTDQVLRFVHRKAFPWLHKK